MIQTFAGPSFLKAEMIFIIEISFRAKIPNVLHFLLLTLPIFSQKKIIVMAI